MKSIFAILFIGIHLLNVWGYYGFFSRLEQLNDDQMASKLNEDEYSGSEAITLMVPVSMPYPVNQDNYERVEGKFKHDGQVYRLVKQKLYNDTLYIVCLKDEKGTRIEGKLKELTSSVTGNPIDSKSGAKTIQQLVKDYEIVSAIMFFSISNGVDISFADFNASAYRNEAVFPIDRPPTS